MVCGFKLSRHRVLVLQGGLTGEASPVNTPPQT